MPSLLTPQSENFPAWYQDVVSKAELAESGPARGTMVIRPTAYAVWERMQAAMDGLIKDEGVDNAYFPLLIPESYLRREAEHVEGFSPELAVVTSAGGKNLEEPLVIRPTSETVIGEYMAKWVQSYRDLPLLLNQWANVVRWEMRPRMFLRTSEFLWQEGHTAHATEDDGRAFARRILHRVYERFITEVLAVPVTVGLKTARERFAGATHTYCLEGCMRDGKALQMGTSHELGQNFAKAFNIGFTDAGGTQQHAWTTSWGTSTRMVGGLIMVHGDDNGLRLPPKLAPVQVQILIVKDSDAVSQAARKLVAELSGAGIRCRLDDRTDTPFGRRAVNAELRGVPIRLELGPRDVASDQVMLVRRIKGGKEPIALGSVTASVEEALAEDQKLLWEQAKALKASQTVDVESLDEAVDAANEGWARIPWSLVGEDGEKMLNGQALTVRCLVRQDGSVPESENEPDLVAYVARAY
ncbi:proline--tRNA ligase [Nocardia speluncae]|uniref:Proline--tRNA ligase n=1 Tax=Nocardia speluncae TaxID=419477 RepID=A0A846XER0_9NOCA|nr:proline--tRNA ligase [Nocardia speluncae]NKY33865.1 proline--tRNA ligase [Nocardia speluncae]